MPDFGPVIVASRLAESLDSGGIRVLDCRFDLTDREAGRRQWLEAHIPGAVFIDLEKDLSAEPRPTAGRHPLPDPDKLQDTFSSLGIGPSTRVVVYDAGNGGIAARAWWLLRWLGHRNVALLERGFAGWIAEGQPTEHGEAGVDRATFEGAPRWDRVVSTADIVDARSSGEPLRLVDARDAVRFRGEVEPIDPVAGRVPGSLNLPFTELMDEDDRFLGRTALRSVFSNVLGEDDAAWVAMCGSGVTACHLAISAQLAGYRPPRLYAGSFSEWIRNPDRPVEIGHA